MPDEKLKFTNGTYTLVETGVKNQLLFARNDGEELKGVSEATILGLLAQYLDAKMKDGTFKNGEMITPHYARSFDKTCIKVTLAVDTNAEFQHIEEEEDDKNDFDLTEKKQNFFKHLFKNLCK